MAKVNEILADRQATHGSYADIVNTRSVILEALTIQYRLMHNNSFPPQAILVMWNDIALKLARGASNPGHQDNWDDLAGYANIIQEVMEEKNAISDK